MRNIGRLLYRYYHVLLFLFLEAVALLCVVTYNDYQRTSFANSASGVAGSIYSWSGNIEGYFDLKEQNEILAKENAHLRNQLPNATFDATVDQVTVIDSARQQHYTYIPGKVLNKDLYHRNNFFTIDVGSKQGVRPDMGVICSDGIVGFTLHVSENRSTVVIVLNENFRGSGTTRHTNFRGQLEWKGATIHNTDMKNIARHADLSPGDSIVTDQSSGRFPPNIPIGTIEEVYFNEGATYQTAKLKLCTDFNSVRHVYVVNNLLREEEKALEALIPQQ